MLKFKLTLSYDGTCYQGWQRQPGGRGIQNQVEAALARLFPSVRPEVTGSSRTDAGVHALGLVAHFEVPRTVFRMPVRHLPLAINACLPGDIRVRSTSRVPSAFHARFDATGKQYRYTVWNHPVMNPLLNHRAWHVPRPLDLRKMRTAASLLIGRHDFSAFTANRGDPLENPVRTLTRCDIRREGAMFTFIIEGDGFLYKMCRGITGTLVQTGGGRLSPEEVGNILARKDRRLAGMNAPSHGLVLRKVFYAGSRSRRSDTGTF